MLGERYASIVTEAAYQPTDPTIESQIVTLQGSEADALIVAATPKFAAQAIRKVYELGWKPKFFLSNTSIWVNSVMKPGGPEKGICIVSSAYVKDPTDPGWDEDEGMKQYKAFLAKYMPDGDITDQNFVNAYNEAMTLVQVLKQCGEDLSRQRIMREATNLHELGLPMLLPGIKVTTTPIDFYPVEQMQLMRWNGSRWVRFGELLSSEEN